MRVLRFALLCLVLLRLPAAHGAVDSISVLDLPPEGRVVLKAIKQGGPFEYDRDGVIFGNRERFLPKQPRGYYREYTVKTPGVRHRGTRRIVCGVVPECY
jgi:ribonuclease T1